MMKMKVIAGRGLVALALLLALVAIGQLLAWQAARAELMRDLTATGLAEERPELVHDVRFERSTEAARAKVAA